MVTRSLRRSFSVMAQRALRTGAKAMKLAIKSARKPRYPSLVKAKPVRASRARPQRTTGMASGYSGLRRYQLYKPAGLQRGETVPLVVMLHGCAQDAQAMATSTRMNRLAQVERFMVLYPEQDRLSNLQNCWNWYDTRTGRAQREADSIAAAVAHICLTQPVNPQRMAVVGMSAGAGMAGLLAVRQPERFQAVVMHSGVGPGQASSMATALKAMRGRQRVVPLAPLSAGAHLPALLVIQGNMDTIVASCNGAQVAQGWAACEGAKAGQPRTVQRGKRYPTEITDYRNRDRSVATLCVVKGLGHAWSGGAPGLSYSDPQGPDASRMAWSFMQKQLTSSAM